MPFAVAPWIAFAFAALAPFATASVLFAILLRRLPEAGEERARRLVPFRLAAFVVGGAQIVLALYAGSLAMRSVVDSDVIASAYGLLLAVVAFVSGGVARRLEEPEAVRSTALGAAILRLRVVPYLAGPILVAHAAAALPLTRAEGSARAVVPWAVVLALVVTALGVAYAGLALALLTGALRPAPRSVADMCRRAAAREGVRLFAALRLPTAGTRFSNAAAVPWARTMIVTDAIRAELDPDELDGVLAHEAGHLSEPPRVLFARLGAATVLLFGFVSGPELLGVFDDSVRFPLSLFGCFFAVLVFRSVRRLARRMEERADARACKTVGGEGLGAALVKIHAIAQAPRVTGQRNVHPDLADRLAALGLDPGPRPAKPPERRRGLVVGLALAAVLTVGVVSAAAVTEPVADAVPERVDG